MRFIKECKTGIDFFSGTRWSDWTKLSSLDNKYAFSHKTIWLIRYFISVPLFFGPLIYVALNALKISSSFGINIYIIGWLFINIVIYPLVAFKVCRHTGIIKEHHNY